MCAHTYAPTELTLIKMKDFLVAEVSLRGHNSSPAFYPLFTLAPYSNLHQPRGCSRKVKSTPQVPSVLNSNSTLPCSRHIILSGDRKEAFLIKSFYQLSLYIFKESATRDYSLCMPLHGAPRSRDKIAFKVSDECGEYLSTLILISYFLD